MLLRMTDKRTASDRAADHAARQRAKGLQKVGVWVPSGSVQRLKDYAAKLRREGETSKK